MIPFLWFRNLFLKGKPEGQGHLILPMNRQIKAWHKANRKMAWGIKKEEFDKIEPPPQLTENDRYEEFIGAVLFYGFGDDGSGHADPVLSGKVAWEYALKCKKGKIWHCEYIRFDKSDYIRLRPGAPPRPKGFYYTKFQPGERFQSLTVSQVRKGLKEDTGCGAEGIQFLAITHTHFQDIMNEKKIPFMALADYDVAPYGFNDFFDAPQLFHSSGLLDWASGTWIVTIPSLESLPFDSSTGLKLLIILHKQTIKNILTSFYSKNVLSYDEDIFILLPQCGIFSLTYNLLYPILTEK